MKLLFKLFLFSLLAGVAFGTPVNQITFTWNYSYAQDPVCTATITVNCISSFVLTDVTLATPQTIATIPATSATAYSYVQTPLPPAMNHNYTLVAVKTLSTGTIVSTPATVTVNVPTAPAPANGFIITVVKSN